MGPKKPFYYNIQLHCIVVIKIFFKKGALCAALVNGHKASMADKCDKVQYRLKCIFKFLKKSASREV